MTSAGKLENFAPRIIAWQRAHGRDGLPWQQPPGSANAAYRVWVSEIMLQQTQVAVVVPYFNRWMQSFSTVTELAAASQDTVLEHWAGLGYYARARNLHAAARDIVERQSGEIPDDAESLIALPGIGRSTAAAIRSLAFGKTAAILDGNVKRVIARHDAIAGWPGKSSVLKALWAAAEQRIVTPLAPDDAARYSQGLMDLGASLCSKHAPKCMLCPVADDCSARRDGTQTDYPASKPKKTVPTRRTAVLYALDSQGKLLLQRRPASGVWGGLWSLPEIPETPEQTVETLGLRANNLKQVSVAIRHQLTHFTWELAPVHALVEPQAVCDDDRLLWWSPDEPLPALPAPIARYITTQLSTD